MSVEALGRIARAEAHLKELGLRRFRVRHHETVARIEVPASELSRLIEDEARRQRIVEGIKALGFTFVTLDLQGFRSGSMNEALPVVDNDLP